MAEEHKAYVHKAVNAKCCIKPPDGSTIEKDTKPIRLPSKKDNIDWKRNLSSIFKAIPKKFPFLSNINESEWKLTLNDIIIQKEDFQQFGELLSSIPINPIPVVKIEKHITVDTEETKVNEPNINLSSTTNRIRVIYDNNSFEWIPPNADTEDEDEWQKNYNDLINKTALKYKLDKTDIKLQQVHDDIEIDYGDDLMGVWQDLVDEEDIFTIEIRVITNKKTETQNQFKLIYKNDIFLWIPPNLEKDIDEEKQWKDNFNILLNDIQKKYKLNEKCIKLKQNDENVDADKLMLLWTDLINDKSSVI
eukprot:149493_1